MPRVSLFVVVAALLLFFSIAIPQIRFESKPIEPLIDSPLRTIGSDFNGDGIHDLVVGAHLNDVDGNATGEAYILYGTSNLSSTYDLSELGGPDVTMRGKAAADYLGYESSTAGDVNADGFDDLILGAWVNDDGGGGSGSAYIVYGSPNLSATFKIAADGGDVTIVGRTNNIYLGFASSGIGDFNGDGFDDVVTDAPFDRVTDLTQAGVAYILFGSAALSATYQLNGVGVDVTVRGQGRYDQFGRHTSSAGDVNLDGFDDVIFGAFQNNDGGTDDEGAAYIMYGGSSISGTIPAGNLDVTMLGSAVNDYLGRDVSGISDINNDGFEDVIAGAAGHDDGASAAGAAHILYGRSSLSGTFDTGSFQEDISLVGKQVASEELGRGVSGVGDVNDDGFYDFIVGARLSNDNVSDGGAAYLVYGGPSLPSRIPAGNNDVTVLGRNSSDSLGDGVMGVGDINNDGIPDFAAGAVAGDGVTTDAGALYIVFGGESISATINTRGDGASVTIAGKNLTDRLGLYIGGGRMSHGP